MTTIDANRSQSDSLSAEIAAAISAESAPTPETISRFEGLLSDLARNRINLPAADPKQLEETRRAVGRSLYGMMSPPVRDDLRYLRELIGELFPRAEQADVLSDSAISYLLGRARALNDEKRQLAVKEANHERSVQALAKATEELEGRERAVLYRVIMQRDFIDMENRCTSLAANCAELRKKFTELASLASQFRYSLDHAMRSFREAGEEMELLRSLMGYLTMAPGAPTSYHALYEDTRTTNECMRAVIDGHVDMSSAQLLYEVCSAWHRSAHGRSRYEVLTSVLIDNFDRFLIGDKYQAGLYSLIGPPIERTLRQRMSFLDWSRWVGKEHPLRDRQRDPLTW